MDAASFYGTRKTNLQAVVPSYAEDSDDGIDSDDDVANPDYTPNTTDATECDVEERDDEYIDSSTMMDSNEGSSNQQLEGPSKMRQQNIVVIEPNDEPSEDNTSREHQWRKRDIDNIYPEEIEFTRPDDVLTPYQYFSQFFTPEMISLITYNTNLFSVQEHSKSINTDDNEIQKFLALLLIMGLCDLPAMDDYWNVQMKYDLVANEMSSKRLKLLKRHIHFC